jgi:TPP-dependent pyruvate/acetoin dehydrogenase alpha subunit
MEQMNLCKMAPIQPIRFDLNDLPKVSLIEMLRQMMRIRRFEKSIAELLDQPQGPIKTPCHLYIGQEAVAVGVCSALNSDDYVFGTHRSHGHYLAKGGDLKKGMAEIFCKESGCSKGRGGSMHLCDPLKGILGTSSIVSGSVPIAVGAGLAESIKGSKRISTVFHGDGVPEEGAWNEAANFAAINKLPVLFVCENNLYCTHLSLNERRVHDNLPELAKAHGIPSISIDGNNVIDVYNTAVNLVERIRNGEGPQFVECRTYRWLGHVGPRDNLEVGLRSREELDSWKQRCPIKCFINSLIEQEYLTTAVVSEMQNVVDQEIEEAIDFARESAFPDESTLQQFVYHQGN